MSIPGPTMTKKKVIFLVFLGIYSILVKTLSNTAGLLNYSIQSLSDTKGSYTDYCTKAQFYDFFILVKILIHISLQLLSFNSDGQIALAKLLK